VNSRLSSGQIISFYSFKGGVGRSMALANVACLLAKAKSREMPVLMVDWDLEAPGLHEFFRVSNSLPATASAKPPEAQGGLLDVFEQIESRTRSVRSSGAIGYDEALDVIRQVMPEEYVTPTAVPDLYLLKAGREHQGYTDRVNSFDWVGLFNRCPHLFETLADYLADRYSYVLIDSRTGLTDIGGICTTLMPQRLVVVFTPNRQSVLGLMELIRQAATYRKDSDDPRQLLVFPLASRIENAEPTLRQQWRFGDADRGVVGYQPLFEDLFKEVYALQECDLGEYFDEIQVQYVPSLAYGEEVSVLTESGSERLSLTRSYQAFCQRLTQGAPPWQRVADLQKEMEESIDEMASAAHHLAGRDLAAGDYEGAMELLENAINSSRHRAKSAVDKRKLATLLSMLSVALSARQQYNRALAAASEARDIYEAAGNREGVAEALKNLTQIHMAAGNWERARLIALDRQNTLRQTSLTSPGPLLEVLFDLATIHARSAAWDKALASLSEASTLAQRLGDTQAQAHIAGRKADVLVQMDRLDEALSSYKESLTLFEQAGKGDSAEYGEALTRLGAAYLSASERTAAEESLWRALSLLEKEEGPSHPKVADALGVLGTLLASRGMHKEARQALERALNINERSFGSAHPRVVKNLIELADAHKVAGGREDSSRILRNAQKAVASLKERDIVEATQLEGAIAQRQLGLDVKNNLEHARKLAESGDFKGARKIVASLPNEPEGIRALKDEWLAQIERAALETDKAKDLNQVVEAAIDNARELVENRRFGDARRVIRSLPTSPPELQDLKKRYLKQIDETEEMDDLNKRVEATVKEAIHLAEGGQFSKARDLIRGLPDKPNELHTLKGQYLGQLAEAEASRAKWLDEAIAQLSRQLPFPADKNRLKKELEAKLKRGVQPQVALDALVKDIAGRPGQYTSLGTLQATDRALDARPGGAPSLIRRILNRMGFK
jgi:MinD-like ATPase involved in chromosome partitioning or flagellar assembly/Tfp pilus assembly protein PilF